MWIADGWKDYEVIDCSGGEKLERWGDYILKRQTAGGIIQTHIITEVKKAAENGNSSAFRSNGRSITGI